MVGGQPRHCVWLHGLSAENYARFVSLVEELGLGLRFGQVVWREEELPLSLLGCGTVSVWVDRDDWPSARQVFEALFPWCDGLKSEPRHVSGA